MSARAIKISTVLALAAALMACTAAPKPQSDPRAALSRQQPSASSAESLAQTYHLGPGDHLRVTVYSQPDLSGEFEVDPSGQVSLPLIEPIPAQGKTVREFQQAVQTRLANGYLVNPRVNVDVLNYRPFYITGEVNKPGEYPYVAGMNILKAIAMAGGYTYRANTGKVFMTHVSSSDELVVQPAPETTVLPGDFIRIPERFF